MFVGFLLPPWKSSPIYIYNFDSYWSYVHQLWDSVRYFYQQKWSLTGGLMGITMIHSWETKDLTVGSIAMTNRTSRWFYEPGNINCGGPPRIVEPGYDLWNY